MCRGERVNMTGTCNECGNSNGNKEEYQELLCAMEHDHVDMSLSTAFYRQRRIQEIQEEYGESITDEWCKELGKEFKQGADQ